MTAYLLLAAIAWAVATRGGTDSRDLGIVLALTAAAALSAHARPRRDAALWITGGVVIAYVVVNGPLRTGWSLESVRMPVLIVLVTITILAVAGMGASDREVLTSGLIVLGTLQALIVLIGVVVSAVTSSGGMSVPTRSDGLLGFPNGLGILLVGTCVLTVRAAVQRGGRLPVALALALAAQVTAILASGSRVAILIGAVLAVGFVVRSATGRRRWRRQPSAYAPIAYAFAGCAVAAGIAVTSWRTLVEPNEDRPHLWLEAVQRIAAAPLVGEGAPAGAFTLASPASRVTTSAHNEFLQWTLEYGVVGLGLAAAVILLAVRGRPAPGGGDRWALVAGMALLASGLTGFTPRITAVALTAAVLVALGSTPASDRGAPGGRVRGERRDRPLRARG